MHQSFPNSSAASYVRQSLCCQMCGQRLGGLTPRASIDVDGDGTAAAGELDVAVENQIDRERSHITVDQVENSVDMCVQGVVVGRVVKNHAWNARLENKG